MFTGIGDARRGNSFLFKIRDAPAPGSDRKLVLVPNGEALINDAVFAEHQPGKVTRF
jgi:hypothetical protein